MKTLNISVWLEDTIEHLWKPGLIQSKVSYYYYLFSYWWLINLNYWKLLILNWLTRWFEWPKKRWQKYTKELYKKDLHNQDSHDGVITHLEPDILDCEVKSALKSITMNKARGGDGIPVELFQILKDDTVKVLHSICQQIWKTQQWPQD